MHRHPRLALLYVTLLALVSLVVLAVAHPTVTADAWARGDTLALVVAWAIALAMSAWLFLATGACLVALGIDRPALARRLAPTLPSGLRRFVEVAITASCIALPALVAIPAGAAPVAPVVRAVAADVPIVRGPSAPAPVTTAPVTPSPVTTSPVTTAAPHVVPTTAPPATSPTIAPVHGPAPIATPSTSTPPRGAPGAASAPARRVIVRAGDNLWLIARAAITPTGGRAPGDEAVARYWRAVIAANVGTLRSGNPSLIFPGEIVTLPARTAVS